MDIKRLKDQIGDQKDFEEMPTGDISSELIWLKKQSNLKDKIILLEN
jgi:hypothetical protein